MPPDRVVAFAPGRVNLIGEHTDYNDGLSLPFAIAQGVRVSATAVGGDAMEARALDLGEDDRFGLADPAAAHGWRAFVRGSVAALQAAGHRLQAARLEITGDVPRGSGLSSSAALEVALCLALLGLAGERDGIDRLALARLCSRVENEWVGARTGLLDQIAALFGAGGQALRIDFHTLEVALVPLELGGWTLVTVDSGERHTHAESGYNDRRRECVAAARALGIASLRDATFADVGRLPAPLDRRLTHVIQENERVDAAVAALRAGDLGAIGPLLDASHASLRDLFEVSTQAVERTVRRMKDAGAVGSRVIGGGFGGHVVALLPEGVAPPADAVVVSPSAGAGLVEP